ncbi:MAG: YkgJ family cysteine cluster protein [Verrucomicrobiota bacterium]
MASGKNAAPSDCRRCGACCFSPSALHVRVTGDDWARLGDRVEEAAHFVGNRAFMRRVDGHCAALAVREDGCGGADFFCTVYESRPQICRDLERGSPQCAGEIVMKVPQSGPPPAPVERRDGLAWFQTPWPYLGLSSVRLL